ncbi:hypothetical protein SAMN02745857_02427 [Andreprevotia lacus DSM 23236]|jgi:hypothetical protein|uniref:Uncharacterized protein n=1 Tax=Andreprevotia lacus DSM 23236 TaxID=1121001 RepID=A0A1W1XQN4_9NEIS|nr:hypothetical protein [Andreprevotia lacus]SMC26216.1 hypothetical protein SAMN02745857_02427 [Andreprevotia lacus DSM 23236]
MRLSLPVLLLALCIPPLATAACKSGARCKQPPAKPAAATPAAPSVPLTPLGTAGIYDVRYGQFSGVYTLLDDGHFSGVHFIAGRLVGHPHGQLSTANSVDHLEPIAWANFIDDYAQVGAQETNPSFGRSFDATELKVTIKGGFGTFSTSQQEQKTYAMDDNRSLYAQAAPLATLAGNYSGYLRTVGIGKPAEDFKSFQLGSDGHFTVQAVDCSFDGQLTPYKNTGVFEVKVNTAGTQCKLAGQLAGLVTPLQIQASGTRLAVQLDDASNAQTAVFILARK